MSPMSPLHACTILLVACSLLVNFVESSYDGSSNSQESHDRVCNTAACVKEAASILEKMDTTVEPCENFYQFACGKFLKETVTPEGKSSDTMLSRTNNKIRQQLKASLERKTDNSSSKSLKLLRSYYNLCLDTEQIEKQSTNDILDILEELGGWPVVDKNWSSSSFSWRNLIYKMRKLGYAKPMDAFIEFSIEVDKENPDKYVFALDQASTGLYREYLLNGWEEKVVQAYYKYMVDVAEVLGAERQQAKNELAESLNFEMELAKISLTREQRRNHSKLYNPMTIRQLQSEYPSDIPWQKYFNRILSPEIRVKLDDRIVIRAPSFLKSFSKLINNTSKRTLANYGVWRVVQSSTYFMNQRIRDIKAEVNAPLKGTRIQEPRSKQCMDYLSNNLYTAVGALYAREYFDRESKSNVEELVSALRKSFAGILDEIDWMDEKTKQTAKKKLSLVKQYIAYPDEILDDEKLDGYYHNIEVHPGSFLKSHLNIEIANVKRALNRFKNSTKDNAWTSHIDIATANALYLRPENSIDIPAGILQGVFFKSDRPNYMNYGSIGWIIGYGLTSGFDDKGSQYNEAGSLSNWWDPKTQQEYRNRVQCIIEQYNNYTVEEIGLNINGQNTQGVNIADNGGIKEAYLAYEDYEYQNGEEPRLPGLPYTPRQLFWISSANTWCAKIRPEAMRSRIITGEDGHYEFRVIGSFSNMPQFSKDFDCPVGSPMNPSEKCTLW